MPGTSKDRQETEKLRVLIVDDEELVRRFVERSCGRRVTTRLLRRTARMR
jgi:hypothetical protein